MRTARVIIFLLFFVFCFLFSAQPTIAQTGSFSTPNTDPDVPRNQHTYAQTVTIEVLSSIHCILTGIDLIDPTQGCVGINPESRKLGISKPELDEYGRPKLTGVIGAASDMIASTYQPIASTTTYTNYLSDNFGIVKKADAAGPPCDPKRSGYGFCGLQPILKIWETTRNIAYALLTLAFIFIGIGVMMRVKIDPRTVMTIQNQIPKVVITIILITFSYAISALLIDLMWVTTYAGNYLLTSNHDPMVGDCTKAFNKNKNDKAEPLSKKSTTTILQTPITYFNQIFARCDDENNYFRNENDRDGGFHVMTRSVANNAGETISDVARSLILDTDDEATKCKWYKPIKCGKKLITNFIGVLISAVVQLIVFVILVITLFKIWFNLLKAYIYTLMYVILAPLMIVFGLLPTKPIGFESWLRRIFVNVAIFPITSFMFVGARLLMDLYDNKTPNQFVPPLIGDPTTVNFGALMAFGVLLLAPTIQKILQDKMGVKNVGTPGIVGAGIASGMAVAGAPVKKAMTHLNRYDARTGDIGALARFKREKASGALTRLSHMPILGERAKHELERRQEIDSKGHAFETNQKRNEERKEKKENRIPIRKRLRNRGKKGSGEGGSGGSGSGSGAPTGGRSDRNREGGYL